MSSYFCQQLSAAVILLPLNTGRHIRIHNLLIKDDKYNKNRNHGKHCRRKQNRVPAEVCIF